MVFQKKNFPMLYCINWPKCIVWLSLILAILGNMCIAVVYFPGCDVKNFEINLMFLIKPFFYMTEKSRQKLKYLENEKSCFTKSIFHHFCRTVSYQNFAQTWECAFKVNFSALYTMGYNTLHTMGKNLEKAKLKLQSTLSNGS